MAKRVAKKAKVKKKDDVKVIKVEHVTENNIFEYCRDIMVVHGANVNISRTIPDARDGLKPVERRFLFTMFERLHMDNKSKFVKSSKLVGDTMGDYHAHGDSSIYQSIVNNTCYWKVNPILIRPQGNFGSITGQGASATRYTEVSMPDFTWDCFFKDWDDDAVDFKLNYSGTLREPEFLPSKYPIALFKGTSSGIGYGLYSGIPPYNINEVCDLTIELIKNPNKKKATLIPDFPNGCQIVDNDFDLISAKGEGSIRLRGEVKKNKKGNLEIHSIPYKTSVNKIVNEQITKLVVDGKLSSLYDSKDYSEEKHIKKHGNKIAELDINVELLVKNGADTNQILDILYKSTSLESPFAINLEMVYDYENIHYNIKSYLLEWINFRKETKIRIYLSRYNKKLKRFHMLEVIISILSKKDSDKVRTKIMRDSEDRAEIIKKLMKAFSITDIQAEVIADFKSHQFSKSSLRKFSEERDSLKDELEVLYDIIHDDDYIAKEIIEELKECKKKYGEPRKCEVIKIKDKDYIEDTNHVIVITDKGYIKKLVEDESFDIGNVSNGDKVISRIFVNNRDALLVFDNKGKCYTLPINDIISCSRESIGYDISNYIKSDSNIISIIKKPQKEDIKEKDSFLFITKNGMVKRSLVSLYTNASKTGLIAAGLKNGDELISVISLPSKSKDILIYTNKGNAVRYSTKDIPISLRMASGVIGIRFDVEDEFVMGVDILDKTKDYLTIITDKGNGKRILMENCTKAKRGDVGYRLIPLGNKENIIGMKATDKKDTIDVYLNNRVVTIDSKDIKKTTKIAKGEKVISHKKGETIIKVR